jgi:hypothetical protein
MANVRQEDVNAAMVNILKKMDSMVEAAKTTYDESYMVLSSVEAVMKNDVSAELKKQTSILMSIESKMGAAAQAQAVGGDPEKFREILGPLAEGLDKIIKAAEKLSPKTAENLSEFFTKLSESLSNLTKDIDESKADAINKLLVGVGDSVLKFGGVMAIYTLISPFAMVGAVMFGLTIRLLVKSAGEVNKESAEGMAAIIGLGWKALVFGASMALYSILSPLAMIGAVMFGLTVRLLLLTAGVVDEERVKQMTAVAMLGWTPLKFAASMILYALVSPIVMIGAVMFGLTIRLLLKSAGVATKEGLEQMQAVVALGWTPLKFAASMILFTLVSPIVILGSVLFGLSIRLLMMSSGAAKKEGAEGMKAVLSLAKGILLYTLAIVVATALFPIVMIGSVLFGLSIRLLLLSSGAASKGGAKQMAAPLKLALGVLLYSLAMVAVTALAPMVLIGTLIISLSLFVLGLALRFMGAKQVRQGIFSLMLASLGIALLGLAVMTYAALVPPMDSLYVVLAVATFGLVFYVAGKFFNEIFKGALAMAAASIAVALLGVAVLIFKKANMTFADAAVLGAVVVGLGIAMYIAGKFATQIFEGALAMGAASIALILLSTALVIFSKAKLTLMDALVLGAVIGAVGITFGLAGAGPIPGFILAGSLALGAASVALIVLGLGLIVFKKAKMQLSDALTLGATVGAIAISFAAMGLASPFILLGSAAMIVASVALLPITGALAVFKASKWKKGTDDENLKSALGAIISGFLGGDMPGGILASIKFAAQAAARAALLFISVPPMILAGMALMTIVPSLATFKKAGFNQSDADNLEYMIGSIVKAFGIVTDTERQKKMGFSVNPFDLFLGIMSLSGAGRVLAGLAEGVQAWANLEVNEWEVIKPGTKDAKLVIKGRRKLSEQDFDNAAYGMAKVITAISGPFAQVGRLERGESSGNPILDAVFSGGFVSKGVEALRYAGDTIVNLAKGVQAFATMQYTEYEVVNAGTSKAKLVPKGVVKLGEAEITAASTNIANVIGVVAKAFADVGRMESESSGIFSGGFVSKGVAALAGVGDNLGAIVDSVLKMANREIPTFDLINGGTKDAKLVPGKPRIISDEDLMKASTTIMDILKVVAGGFYDIGKMEDDSSSWWGDGYITKGVKAIAGIGDTVAKVTDAVIKIATGEMPQMKEVDGKLVPGAPIKVTDAMLKAAARTINDIMMVLGHGMYDFGKFYTENQEPIDAAVSAVPDMSEALSKLADSTLQFGKMKPDEVAAAVINLRSWSDEVRNVFGLFANGDPSTKIPIATLMTAVDAMPKIKRATDDMANSVSPWQKLEIEKAKGSFDTWHKTIYETYGLYSKSSANFMPAIAMMPMVKASVDQMADANSKWGQLQGAEQGITNFQKFTTTVFSVFDQNQNAMLKQKLDYMGVFVQNIQTMAKPAEQLKKVADNMDRIQKSMKLTKDSINAMDLKKLTLTDAMMRSLAAIAKNPEAMAKAVEGGIDKAFQDLAEALKELATQQQAQQESLFDKMANVMTGGGNTPTTTTTTPGTNKPGQPQQNQQPQKGPSTQELASALQKALSGYFGSNTIKVKPTSSIGSD